jgi:DNA-binding NtrC family response regulator
MDLEKTVVVSRKAEIRHLANCLCKQVFVADDPTEALDIIRTANPGVILFDHCHNSDGVREFISGSSQYLTNVPVIVIGNEINAENSLTDKFTQAGARGYFQLTDNLDQLIADIRRITKNTQTTTGNSYLSDDHTRFFTEEFAGTISMVGKSKAISDTLKMIKIIADSRCNPILILGETGTGKEVTAKAIHLLRHPDKRLVAINCAALTSTLLESELFGHVKGAFTGADCDKTGLLELAGDGTIMLDEISEMPTALQAKLLRVLEERQFRKVGGTKNISCNATIIAASNRNLNEEVRENRFRRDLYYRLNISPITLVPLRSPHRSSDIGLLAEYFLKTSTICPAKSKKITSLTSMAAEALTRHNWPGNVRELRNVIERAILLSTTDKIGLNEIIFDCIDSSELILQQENSQAASAAAGNKIDFSLEKAERELISRALQETGWQKTRAADLLGITRATLYAKLKQYNIEKQSGETTCFTDQPENDFAVSCL